MMDAMDEPKDLDFDNPEYDDLLRKIGFLRPFVNKPLFKKGGIQIDLSKGMTKSNIRKIIDVALKQGSREKSKQIRELLND